MREFALAMLVLTACGGGGTDIDATLRFADLTDAEIGRLISAASGSDMFQAQSQVDQFGDTFGETDPCPAITIDGDTATITGGCTTLDGMTIEGTATVTNPSGWDQIEWSSALDTDYDVAISFDYGAGAQSYDGVMSRSNDFTTWDADIIVDSFGVIVRSDIRYVCATTGQSCSLSGSGIELVGVGGARVSGTVRLDGETTVADYTLRGEDTLTATITQGCVEWQISGSDREMICAP